MSAFVTCSLSKYRHLPTQNYSWCTGTVVLEFEHS